jgi:hypothetical protein
MQGMRTTEKCGLLSPRVFAMQIAQVPSPGQEGTGDFVGVEWFAVLHRQEPSPRTPPQLGQMSMSSDEEHIPPGGQQVHDGGRSASPSVSEPDWLNENGLQRQDEHEKPCAHCGSAAPAPVANKNATRLTKVTKGIRFWIILQSS